MQLEGKHVLVTGGTRGIGKCIIKELVNQGVKRIAVIARDKQNLKQLSEEFENIKILRISGNVANVEVLREAAARIEDKWGHLDVLINNVGIVSAGSLEDLHDADLYDQVAVNLISVLLLTKYCIPLLKAAGEASILNISSVLGLIGMPFYAVYGSTKAGISQFSDSMRRELAPYNISVTCSFPTSTDTDMMKKFKDMEMDAPEYVAKRSIEGMLNKELQVVFGGKKLQEEVKINFEAPIELDAVIAQNYEKRKSNSLGHKTL